LEKGEASISSEAHFDFQKIVVADIHPTLTLKSRPSLDTVRGILFFLLILTVIVLAVYGGEALYADWRHILK
jgi:K+ transporter